MGEGLLPFVPNNDGFLDPEAADLSVRGRDVLLDADAGVEDGLADPV